MIAVVGILRAGFVDVLGAAAISHHQGLGLARLPYIRESLGTGMIPLRRLKNAFDPADIVCPGKLGLT